MKNRLAIFFFCISISRVAYTQTFSRSELSTPLTTPWEITYGPDGFLWITESGGKVVRVDPVMGNKTVIYTAPDYFGGSPLEQSTLCTFPNIGSGTLGLALHPDFMNPVNSFVYFVYSYNSGSPSTPVTRFKIVRFLWDASSQTASGATDIVTDLPNGYDHLGGRLMAINRNGIDYLFFTAGDNGISDETAPSCYNPQSTNPNNFTMDMNYKNGKIHRFLIDGTIPIDNPVPGNSIYTRGHRNPQGLMYNAGQDILYGIEHGDRTDDEINILESGHNYGWKYVRGYHGDNNYPGEATFVASYIPDPGITGDALAEPLYSWCDTQLPVSTNWLDWCTVAPSDGIYYNSNGIPEWTNSLLVVTLKDGAVTDEEVFCFKLLPGGNGLVTSTTQDPNPMKYFSSDQSLNGRLRDITFSTDGLKIYLINNGGTNADKITVYTYTGPSSIQENPEVQSLIVTPNPATNLIHLSIPESELISVNIISVLGNTIKSPAIHNVIDISDIAKGVYTIVAETTHGYMHYVIIKD